MFYAFTRFSPGADMASDGTLNTSPLSLHDDLIMHQRGNDWMVVSPSSGGWCILDRFDYELLRPAFNQKSLVPLTTYLSKEHVTTIAEHLTHCGLTAHIGATQHPSEWFSLTFLMNTTCNLACRYCYLSLSPRPYGQTLSYEAAATAIAAAFNQPLNRILIDFGEIAVDFSKVQQLVGMAQEFASAHPDKQLQLAVQTNGTRLNKRVVDFIEQQGIIVGVSLDGPQAMHDAVRVTLNNGLSHASCEAGLRALIERGIPHIVLCTISAANVRHADTLAAYFLELGVTDFSFKPVIRRGSAQVEWEQMGVSVPEYNKFLDDLVCYAIRTQQWNVLDDRLVRYLFRLMRDPRGWSDACPTHACGCGSRMFVVNPYGAVFACPRFASTDADAPGKLGENLLSVLQAPGHNHGVDPIVLHPGCDKCPWVTYCGGGCTLTEQDPLCGVYSHMYDLILTKILPNLAVIGSGKSKLGRISVVNDPIGKQLVMR